MLRKGLDVYQGNNGKDEFCLSQKVDSGSDKEVQIII